MWYVIGLLVWCLVMFFAVGLCGMNRRFDEEEQEHDPENFRTCS